MTQPPTYDPDCQYIGNTEMARDAKSGRLKEVHICKNKRCIWVFCESAFRARACPEQEVMPV